MVAVICTFHLTGAAGVMERCVTLSWGHDDAETYVSTLPLRTLRRSDDE